MKQTKADKALDKLIEKIYCQVANGVQVNVMDIPKIFSESRSRILSGLTPEAAVTSVVFKYRLN